MVKDFEKIISLHFKDHLEFINPEFGTWSSVWSL